MVLSLRARPRQRAPTGSPPAPRQLPARHPQFAHRSAASCRDLRNNRANAPHQHRRPPLSGSKQPTPPAPRRERRAADRQERFEAARGDHKAKPGVPRKGGAPLVNSRSMTLVGVAVGVLVVALAVVGQLGGRSSGALVDPGIAYLAAIQHDNTLGGSTAPVTLDVYDDFQCPFCARSALDTEPSIVSRYVAPGLVRIVHHDFEWIGADKPLRESRLAAAGGICAVAQGKYWNYAPWVFANQGTAENTGAFAKDRLLSIAKSASLDTTAFGSCIDAADTLAQVDAATATDTPLISGGTPSFYINGQFAVSGYQAPDALGKLIDAALAKASGAPSGSAAGSASPAVSASANP